jgi:hypothetical protein
LLQSLAACRSNAQEAQTRWEHTTSRQLMDKSPEGMSDQHQLSSRTHLALQAEPRDWRETRYVSLAEEPSHPGSAQAQQPEHYSAADHDGREHQPTDDHGDDGLKPLQVQRLLRGYERGDQPQ